jgi:(p)ppGpp synthase/HD superfamily hydrolase
MRLTKKFDTALYHASEVHTGQYRKGTRIPYLSHLLGTASIALEYGASETEAIGALLHDAVEDGGGISELNNIREKFGDEVAEIVKGCTDAYVKPKPPWKERKKAYLVRLRHESKSVCLVSASDKLCNARSILKDYRQIGEKLWERFKGKKKGTLWYYRGLIEAFQATGFHKPLVRELDRVVSEIERLSSNASHAQ